MVIRDANPDAEVRVQSVDYSWGFLTSQSSGNSKIQVQWETLPQKYMQSDRGRHPRLASHLHMLTSHSLLKLASARQVDGAMAPSGCEVAGGELR